LEVNFNKIRCEYKEEQEMISKKLNPSAKAFIPTKQSHSKPSKTDALSNIISETADYQSIPCKSKRTILIPLNSHKCVLLVVTMEEGDLEKVATSMSEFYSHDTFSHFDITTMLTPHDYDNYTNPKLIVNNITTSLFSLIIIFFLHFYIFVFFFFLAFLVF